MFILTQAIAETWDRQKGNMIQVGSASMRVLDIPVKVESTYEEIWAESEPCHGLQLRFEMLTRFSHYGRDHILPIPRGV